MASRHLAAVARSAEDYLSVYARVLSQASRPVILHWLGEMFDPQLGGYWGSVDVATATRRSWTWSTSMPPRSTGSRSRCCRPSTSDGCARCSRVGSGSTPATTQLSRAHRGRRQHHSDALLGAFAAIAPAAAAALAALATTTWRPTGARWRRPWSCPGTCSPRPPTTTKRDRLPGLAERASGRVRHGGWSAVGEVGRPSGPGLRAGQRRAAAQPIRTWPPAPRPSAGHRRPRSMTVSVPTARARQGGRPPWTPKRALERLSLNQRTDRLVVPA